jgi:hypothetical protein
VIEYDGDLDPDKPTMREWVDMVRQFDPVGLTMSPAEAIAAERDRLPAGVEGRLIGPPRRGDFIVGDPEELVSRDWSGEW